MYEFHYHYLLYFEDENTIMLGRELDWGDEYLSYLKYVKDNVLQVRLKTLLDVGCGDGRFLNYYHGYDSACCIKGIDLSERAIGFAKAFNPELVFEVQDIENENKKYDVIVCIETIEHVPGEKLKDFYTGLFSAVKDDGTVFITVPSIVRPVNPKHFRHYSAESLVNEVTSCSQKSLVIDKVEYIVPEVEKADRLAKKYLKKERYLKYRWKRLWRNGLVADSKTGTHIFARVSLDL